MMSPQEFRQTVAIVNPSGLHARAAGKVSLMADEFQARVWIEKGNQTAPAESLLDLMMLMANQGDTVTVKATGEEAEAAVAAISALIAKGFGEMV